MNFKMFLNFTADRQRQRQHQYVKYDAKPHDEIKSTEWKLYVENIQLYYSLSLTANDTHSDSGSGGGGGGIAHTDVTVFAVVIALWTMCAGFTLVSCENFLCVCHLPDDKWSGGGGGGVQVAQDWDERKPGHSKRDRTHS